MHETEGDLTELAEQIRLAYWEVRARFEERTLGQTSISGPMRVPKWDGGLDNLGRRHEGIWPMIAALFFREGLSVEPTIKILFDSLIGTLPAKPEDLMNKGFSRFVESRRKHSLQEIRHRINSEKRAAEIELAVLESTTTMSKRLIYRRVIVSSSLPLSDIFRFCFALQTEQLDLAEEYRDAAFQQYFECSEEYNIVLGDFIPHDFKLRVREIAQEWRE